MQKLPTGEPVWDLQFNEAGQLTSPVRDGFLAEVAAAGVTDLFAFSHGWGASQDGARRRYGRDVPDDPQRRARPGRHRDPGEPFSGAHSDIRKPPVAQLAAAAAAAHA